MVLDSLRPDPLIGGASDLGGLRLEAQSRVRRPLGRHAAMGEALLLAQRDGLDPDLRDRFARAGLAHLLAISGFHVGLIAGGLLVLGRLLRLSQRTAALTSILVTGAYVLFLGAPHAAARAALQVGLVLVATMLQRPADPFALLAAAALLLTAIDPLAVLEPGFQLSFAGVAGIILLRRRILDQIPGQRGRALRESLATSIAATIATAPVCVVHFGQVAPVGVIANLLAIPLTAVVVPALALTISMGTISSGLATFLGGGTGLLLDALGAVAATAAALPGGSRFVPHDAVFGWVVGAAAVSAILLLPDRIGAGPVFRPAIRRVAAVGIVLAILVAWPLAGSRIGNGALEIHMIDVGQGDAIAIRTPAGRWILVDAGPRSGRNDAGRTRVVPFLLRNGVRSLEAIVLTHPDADHIGGAASVLAAFPVGTLVDPGRATGKSMYLDLLGTAERKGTAWVAARAGREIDMDGITIRVLYPRHDVLDEQHDANAFSVAFHLAYGGFGALFLGDAPAAVEEHLAAMYGEGLRANVIKVAHHGSRTSTADALLDVVQPELALISAGRHNRYGHPAPEVLRRLDHHGVRVLRTDLRGTISLRVSRDGRIESRTVR